MDRTQYIYGPRKIINRAECIADHVELHHRPRASIFTYVIQIANVITL